MNLSCLLSPLVSFKKKISLRWIGILLAGALCVNIIPSIASVIFEQNLGIEQAQANDPAQTSQSNTKSFQQYLNDETGKDMRQKFAEIASLFIGFFIPLVAILVKFIGVLMGDDYIFGANEGGVPIAQVLYELWDIIRTIVNYGFLLILLFYAVMNIIPFGTDEYEIKSVLPSLVVAIVVVNLTWFGARVVFDVVDVSARIVYGLPEALTVNENNQALSRKCIASTKHKPSDVFKPGSKEPYAEAKDATEGAHVYMHGNCYPSYLSVDFERALDSEPKYTPSNESLKEKITTLQNLKSKSDTNESQQKRIDQQLERLEKLQQQIESGEGAVVDYGTMVIYWTDFDYSKFNESSIAQLFAFSVMQIQNLPRTAYSNIEQIAQSSGGQVQNVKNANTWTKIFINTLAALIIMTLVTVLFVMMMINLFFRVIILWLNIIASPLMAFKLAWKGPGGNPAGDYLGVAPFLLHAFAPVIMGIPLVIGFIMITIGKSYDFFHNSESGITEFSGPLLDGVSDIHQLFYYIMTIAILWIGGVKAIEGTTTGFVKSTFIDPISNGVSKLGSTLAKTPMYIQFIPAGKDEKTGKQRFLDLKNVFRDIPNDLQRILPSKSDTNYRDAFKPNLTYTQKWKQKIEIDKNDSVGWRNIQSGIDGVNVEKIIRENRGESDDNKIIKRITRGNSQFAKAVQESGMGLKDIYALSKNGNMLEDELNFTEEYKRLRGEGSTSEENQEEQTPASTSSQNQNPSTNRAPSPTNTNTPSETTSSNNEPNPPQTPDSNQPNPDVRDINVPENTPPETPAQNRNTGNDTPQQRP